MRHFVLDTSIIIRDPSALAKSSDQTRIVVPQAVILELARISSSNKSIRPTLKLLQDAFNHGVYRLDLPDSYALSSAATQIPGSLRFNASDFIILKSVETYAKHLIDPSDSKNVFFVTEDKDLFQQAEALGINVIDYSGFKAALQSVSVSDDSINRRGHAVLRGRKRAELIWFASGIGSGVLASIIASLATVRFRSIVATINIWGTIVLLPLLGVFLFWWRSRYRLSYGIGECAFGLITTLGVFIPQFDYTRLTALSVVQVLAGLYVIVRGMDNIGVGLEGTRFERPWTRVFGE